mmetsp:Transcript_84829/g.226362  ORF Transcript_84829/g.226362 Transcript_84829/m.226362 type:complete len:91 (+) Transcript_84829:83-355(+)
MLNFEYINHMFKINNKKVLLGPKNATFQIWSKYFDHFLYFFLSDDMILITGQIFYPRNFINIGQIHLKIFLKLLPDITNIIIKVYNTLGA